MWAKSGSNVFHCLSSWVLLAIAVENGDLERAVHLAQALLDPDPFYQPVPARAGELLAEARAADEDQRHGAALMSLRLALEAAGEAREL